jgi:hypothetical protein
MSNSELRMWLIGGSWTAATIAIVGSSFVAGASLSTSVLLMAWCAAPLGVARIIGFGAPPPTAAQALYAVDTPTDRR